MREQNTAKKMEDPYLLKSCNLWVVTQSASQNLAKIYEKLNIVNKNVSTSRNLVFGFETKLNSTCRIASGSVSRPLFQTRMAYGCLSRTSRLFPSHPDTVFRLFLRLIGFYVFALTNRGTPAVRRGEFQHLFLVSRPTKYNTVSI